MAAPALAAQAVLHLRSTEPGRDPVGTCSSWRSRSESPSRGTRLLRRQAAARRWRWSAEGPGVPARNSSTSRDQCTRCSPSSSRSARRAAGGQPPAERSAEQSRTGRVRRGAPGLLATTSGSRRPGLPQRRRRAAVAGAEASADRWGHSVAEDAGAAGRARRIARLRRGHRPARRPRRRRDRSRPRAGRRPAR